jgi:hypothetical protein
MAYADTVRYAGYSLKGADIRRSMIRGEGVSLIARGFP